MNVTSQLDSTLISGDSRVCGGPGQTFSGGPSNQPPPPGAVRRNKTYEAAFDVALCMGHPRGGFQTCHCSKLKGGFRLSLLWTFSNRPSLGGAPLLVRVPQAVACLACPQAAPKTLMYCLCCQTYR